MYSIPSRHHAVRLTMAMVALLLMVYTYMDFTTPSSAMTAELLNVERGSWSCDGLNIAQVTRKLHLNYGHEHVYTYDEVSEFACSMLHHQMNATAGLKCASKPDSRYNHLRPAHESKPKVHYFFALDLHQAVHVIIPLMGAIIEAMRYLGPEHCALSIVEGRSRDGTHTILAGLKAELAAMGVPFFLSKSFVDPKALGENRITALSALRNQALEPLFQESKNRHSRLSSDPTIVFVNDIVLCPEDILELLHQRVSQSAAMTCAFDWNAHDGPFYDSWVSRSMSGNLFFEITHDGKYWLGQDMFFDHPDSADRWRQSLPIQVYSCWGGMVTLDAKPFLQNKVTFRAPKNNECGMGEPMTLAQDLWRLGLGKILAVPTVHVAYEYDISRSAKEKHGYTHDAVASAQYNKAAEKVKWQESPPPMVKCMPVVNRQSWMAPT